MSLNIWEYKTCESKATFDKTDKKMWQVGELIWILEIDGEENPREEGLEKLGAKGWELVGVQVLQTMDWLTQGNSQASHSAFPKSLYIFKRPA